MIDLKILIVVFLSFGYGCCGQNSGTTSRRQLPDYNRYYSFARTVERVGDNKDLYTEEYFANWVKGYCNDSPIIAFNNTDKRHPDYILGPNETSLNDNGLNHYYGQHDIAVYVGPDPGANHCGTNNPIYGKEIKEVAENMDFISLCFGVNPRCGFLGYQVYCDHLGHYIYSLSSSSTPGNSAVCTVPYNYTLYYSTDISVSVPTPIEEAGKLKYRFLCEFNVSTTNNFWYTVNWYRDGSLIKTHEPIFHSDDIAQNTLLTEDMLGTNSLGFKIQCSYAVSFQNDSETGHERRSPEKIVGIKILTPTVHIQDGQHTGVKIRSTVPFGCLSTQPNCALIINIIDPSSSQFNPSCDPTFSFATCGIRIPSDQWNREFTINISADPATQYGSKEAVNTISLQTSNNFLSHSIWQNYNIGSVVIKNSQDTSKIEGSHCFATGDPYITTFGAGYGKRYEHQYEGVFTLYQNAEWKQEVQINTATCRRGVTCICGAAIRVGREVFVVDRCAPLAYWKIGYTQCSGGTNIALMDITRVGSYYKIKLPSGLTLETRIHTSTKFLNLYLYPSEADVSAVGLCGALGSDLFKKRDGSIVTYQYSGMPDFSDSWRVTTGMVDLFSDDITTLVDLTTETGGIYCKCTTPLGSTEPQFTCEKTTDACVASLGNSQPVAVCKVGDLVNKRSAPNNRFVRSIKPQHFIKKRAALTWRNGWDQAKAEAYCYGVYSNSTLVKKCQQIGTTIDAAGPRENCIRDIEYMADTSFALVYIESIASQCEREVVYNTTFHTAAAGQTPLLDQIKEVLCPLDCSYQGVCVIGRCQCNTGWSGVDCSLELSIIPLVDHVDQSGHCDLFKGQCSDISVFGGDFIDNTTTCRIVSQQLSEAGDYSGRKERDESATVESISQVKCPLSASNRKRRTAAAKPEEEFVQVYSVSVSNNGTAYSNSSLVVVFNSRCQFCAISNGQVQCHYTGDYCFSDGNCYGKSEPHLVHKSYTCSVNNGVREWILSGVTGISPEVTTRDFVKDDGGISQGNLTWIAGVAVGVLVLAGVAIAIGVAYCRLKKNKGKVYQPEESNEGLPPHKNPKTEYQL